MGSRGAALPTVLALVSVVLITGLAMASLSTLSLRFNRKHLDTVSSELAARSAMARFLAKVQENNALTTLNPLRPDPVDIAQLFPSGIIAEENGYTARIFFGTEAGYSSDNLTGEAARLGWPDGDGVARIPPYSVDLVINVEKPSGDVARFRAVLARVWPFAVYVDQGPLTITGVPGSEETMNSHILGDVFTTWIGSAEGGSAEYSIGRGYGLGKLEEPSDLLANLEAGSGYQVAPIKTHLIIGSRNYFNYSITEEVHLDADDNSVAYTKYLKSDNPRMKELDDEDTDPNFGAAESGSGGVVSAGNLLEGDFMNDHDQNLEIPPHIVEASPPNEHVGEVQVRSGLALDPLAELSKDNDPLSAFASGELQSPNLTRPSDNDWLSDPLGIDPDSPDLVLDGSGTQPMILRETLELSNGTFQVNSSVSNRQIVYHNGESDSDKQGLYVREFRAGLVLQDAALLVDGDLNLGASGFQDPSLPLSEEERTIPISGSGSTLVVTGQLILGNADINAGDRTFVIYAEDIVLKGGGTFHGLLVARNSISILTTPGESLHIKGALLCAGEGGITVKGARVTHEPRYLKAINGGGDFYMASWRKL